MKRVGMGFAFRLTRSLVAGLALLCVTMVLAGAQDYPSRPITLIVPFPPGGGNDTLARIVAAKLSAALGQQVVIDNRGGANGAIAMRTGARAAPDGHTLIFANSSTTSITPALHGNVGYDSRKDFAPIGMLASMGIGIIAHPSFPAKTVADLIELAKREPGKLNIGTSAPGSGSHLAAELLKARAGIDVTLVPYKGSAALANDVLGGHMPLVFSVLTPALGNVQVGRLRVLAVTGRDRVSLLPDVPTVAESGLPGFEAVLRYGLLAPAGTPRPIVERLNKELRAAVETDDVRARIANEAGSPLTSSPEEYAAEIEREDGIWFPLIRRLGLKI
jgi:tripartite-type tricarboxylate transporter receptor subunit TctC